MKKTNKKLTIHRQTLRVLNPVDTTLANGGFTYSLSTGDNCQKSNAISGGGQTCQCNYEAPDHP